MEFFERRQWHDRQIYVNIKKRMDFLGWAEVAESIFVSSLRPFGMCPRRFFFLVCVRLVVVL